MTEPFNLAALKTKHNDLVERLRAVKACEDEPEQCSQGGGGFCDAHEMASDYVPLLREAADALASTDQILALHDRLVGFRSWLVQQHASFVAESQRQRHSLTIYKAARRAVIETYQRTIDQIDAAVTIEEPR